MFGLDEIQNTFGALTVGLVIEVIVAVIGIFIAYKKLKDKIIGSYEERKQQEDNINEALEGVRAMPKYRQQSIEIQKKLSETDERILETCNKIQDGVNENQRILNARLDKLENRERNTLRAQILSMHRLFTSKKKNPLGAWTEMERDAFDDLIRDYESLNGNGHVHTVVIPDMNLLRVILMSDTAGLEELFHSREA
jgi:hypothetical protein